MHGLISRGARVPYHLRVDPMSGTILVRDIMRKNVKTVRTDDTALDAVRKMNKFYITSVVVTNGGRPVGIITSRNILEMVVEPRIDPATMYAKEIMSSPLISSRSSPSLRTAGWWGSSRRATSSARARPSWG